MPGYIAWVYVYGLSTQMAQADGTFNRWNEEDYRKTYYEKLVKKTDAIVESVITEEPSLVQHVEDEEAPENADTDEEGEESEPEPPKPATDTSKVKPMQAKAQPKAEALRSS